MGAAQVAWRERNKELLRERARQWYYANKDRAIAKRKKWREEHRGDSDVRTRNREQQKQWRLANPDKSRESRKLSHLKRSYSLTLEEYNKLLIDAENRCEVCGREEKLAVDHNHTTGNVRGILCTRCNTAAGQLGDDPNLIHALADYMRERNKT